jgi:hypothetical protein
MTALIPSTICRTLAITKCLYFASFIGATISHYLPCMQNA